jgi:MFS family permease
VAPEDESQPLEVGETNDDDHGHDDNDDEFDDDDEGLFMLDHTDLITNGIRECGLPGPPDGGWGWVIVLASFMINLIMDGVTSSFSVLLPQIVVTYRDGGSPDIGRSDVAWAGSLLCGVSLCVGPVTSALTNKYGCRPICMIGAIISAIGFIGAAYSPNLQLLLVTYGLIAGVGFGMLYLPAIVCVSYYFESKRARATGIAVSGSGVGAIVFAPLITSLNEVADWRHVCLGFAGLLALLLVSTSSF